MAFAVLHNTVSAWTELCLLPKCVLCIPPKKGSSNEQASAAFTLDRLARWEAGERMSLWRDRP
eukprot:8462755-Karenia_brevis.AAC.1